MRVPAAITARDALDKKLCIVINKNGHEKLVCGFNRFLRGLGHARSGDECDVGFS